jgi:hypothetical protein
MVVVDCLMGRKIKYYSLMMNLTKCWRIPNGVVYFLESFKGKMSSKNKVQWLDLASHLWPPLVRLPLAKTIQVHYDVIVKYSKHQLSSSSKNYYWFFQYIGSDNGDVCNVMPSLGIKYFESFYSIISFYSIF